MENKYVSFEVYRPVKSPTEKRGIHGKDTKPGAGTAGR